MRRYHARGYGVIIIPMAFDSTHVYQTVSPPCVPPETEIRIKVNGTRYEGGSTMVVVSGVKN